MQYSTEPHSADLSGLVTSIWCYKSEPGHAFEHVQPGVASQLLINLHEDELRHWTNPQTILRSTGPVGVQGLLTTPVLIDTRQKRNVCGVAFSSFGLSAFCEKSASAFTDTIIDATNLWNYRAVELRNNLLNKTDPAECCQVIEQFLVNLLPQRIKPKQTLQAENKLLEEIEYMVRSGATLTAVRKSFNLSQRALHTLFDRRIGVRPKTFARVNRFNLSLALMSASKPLSDIANDTGHSDQAHFTREFRSFSGNSPTRHHAIDNESNHTHTNLDVSNTT